MWNIIKILGTKMFVNLTVFLKFFYETFLVFRPKCFNKFSKTFSY